VYLVGDAAGQVKVTTVGGVVNGLWGAQGAAEAILAEGHRTLPSLRLELGLHRLIRTVLNQFDEDDYRVLLEELDTTARGSLARYSRDETSRLLWHLLRRRPRFLVHGFRALIGGHAESQLPPGPEARARRRAAGSVGQ
jgi:flavin-dependent dehydrogenase